MSLHSSSEGKTGSGVSQTKGSRKASGKAELARSKSHRRRGESLSLESLVERIRPIFAESLKPENFPFFVLFVLAAVSLVSRIWLMRH